MLFTSAARPSVSPRRRSAQWVATPRRARREDRGEQVVIALIVVVRPLLTASANGFATHTWKIFLRTAGGQGVIALQTTDRNGEMVAALQVLPDHELMLISSNGTLVRTPVADVSVVGRNTQGVRLIRLDEGDRLTGVERVENLGEEFGGTDDAVAGAAIGTDEGAGDLPVTG